MAADGGDRPAGLRPDRAQRQREPHERGPRTAAASARSWASRSPPATSPTTSSSTRRAGSRACSTAAGSTRSPASRSAPPTRATSRPDDGRRAQRRRRRAPLHRRRRLRRLPRRRRPTATTASGTRTRRRRAAAPYAAFPRYPGLLERAQQRSAPRACKVPWYISRGNHDGLIQGNAPASTDLFRAIAVGCLKVFPSAARRPGALRERHESEVFAQIADPSFIQQLLAGARTVPPDPDRRSSAPREYKARDRRLARLRPRRRDRAHARPTASPRTTRSARRPASRWSRSTRSPRAAGRAATSTTRSTSGSRETLRKRPSRGRRLVIVYGHHTLATMSNTRTDEQARHVQPGRRAGLRRRPAQVDAAAPRARGLKNRARPVPASNRT